MTTRLSPTPAPRILIVEDSDTMWYLYNDLLGEEYSLHRAADGRDALYQMVHVKPNLIVLDWTLDEIRPWDEDGGDGGSSRAARVQDQKTVSGLEVLRVIKRSPFKTTPIIMLTGHKGLHEKVIGKVFGADKYLTKPLDEDTFVRTVRAFVPTLASTKERPAVVDDNATPATARQYQELGLEHLHAGRVAEATEYTRRAELLRTQRVRKGA